MNVWEENKFKRDVIKIVPRIIENLSYKKCGCRPFNHFAIAYMT